MNRGVKSPSSGLILLYAPALLLLLITVPAIGFFIGLFQPQPDSVTFPTISARAFVSLLWRTLAVAAAIACISILLAVPAAWWSRRLRPRMLVLITCPLLMPNYLVYSSLSLLRAPGTPLGDLLETASASTWRSVGVIQAVVGLSLWIWPLAALVIGIQARRINRESIDALRASGAAPIRCAWLVASQLRASVLTAFVLIFVLMLGSSVPLHVAQVPTYAIELWRWMSESGAFRPFWLLALPIVGATFAISSLLIAPAVRSSRIWAEIGVERDPHVAPAWAIAAIMVWSLSIILPLFLFLRHLNEWTSLLTFWPRARSTLTTSAIVSICVSAICFALTLSIAAHVSQSCGRPRRHVHTALLIPWIGALFIPGIIVGAAISSASTSSSLAFLTDSLAGVILAHTIRFGGIAAIVGWWLAASEPRELRDARRMMADEQILPWLRTSGRLYAGFALAGSLVIALFSFHEIEASVIAAPPMAHAALFPEHMLALLHYLRDEELSAAAVHLILAGLIVAALVAFLPRPPSRLTTIARPAALLLCACLCVACEENHSSTDPSFEKVICGVGRGNTQFIYPRAIDSDGRSLWTVDKTARVQHLTPDGKFIRGWTMPAYSKGMPVGITCGTDGLIYVADTHEHRVTVFNPESETPNVPIATFGAYGTELGNFVYPTDVAFMHDDTSGAITRIFVSEYGGNDRITVFDPSFAPLFAFGSLGSSAAPEKIQFNRPQSILFLDDRNELIVADAINHRIGRFTPDGDLIAWIGRVDGEPGSALGEFSYPYGLCAFDQNRILVCEYGASRVQLVDLDQSVGIAAFGSPGRDPGQLAAPWAVTLINDDIFVLDSKNNRIGIFNLRRKLSAR